MEKVDLLQMLKESLGILKDDTNLDFFYNEKLNQAKADLSTEDINKSILESELGKTTIVFYATLLIKEQDVVTNPTLTFLRNKLSCISKGTPDD